MASNAENVSIWWHHRVKAPNDLNECNTYGRLHVCDDLTREMHDKKQNNKKTKKLYAFVISLV